MTDGHVVGLEVVVHGHFPVHIPVLEVKRRKRHHVLEPVSCEVLREATPDLRQGRGIATQAHEDETELYVHAHGAQPVVVAIKSGKALAHRIPSSVPSWRYDQPW